MYKLTELKQTFLTTRHAIKMESCRVYTKDRLFVGLSNEQIWMTIYLVYKEEKLKVDTIKEKAATESLKKC